jgi:hypothetical protein
MICSACCKGDDLRCMKFSFLDWKRAALAVSAMHAAQFAIDQNSRQNDDISLILNCLCAFLVNG